MWACHRKQRRVAAGVVIAGLLALVASPGRCGSVSSAAISAVAKVEYPVGATPLNRFLPLGPVCIPWNGQGEAAGDRTEADRIVLYVPSSGLYIEVTSFGGTPVTVQLPDGETESGRIIDGSDEFLWLDIPNPFFNDNPPVSSPVTITLTPAGI